MIFVSVRQPVTLVHGNQAFHVSVQSVICILYKSVGCQADTPGWGEAHKNTEKSDDACWSENTTINFQSVFMFILVYKLFPDHGSWKIGNPIYFSGVKNTVSNV